MIKSSIKVFKRYFLVLNEIRWHNELIQKSIYIFV